MLPGLGFRHYFCNQSPRCLHSITRFYIVVVFFTQFLLHFYFQKDSVLNLSTNSKSSDVDQNNRDLGESYSRTHLKHTSERTLSSVPVVFTNRGVPLYILVDFLIMITFHCNQ